MNRPISPPTVVGGGRNELPAYVSNGVVGLRVRDNPLIAGMTLVNGFSGEHSVRRIEAAAVAPYPIAGDVRLNGVWMSDAPEAVKIVDQAYDFETAELTSRVSFAIGDCRADIEVLTFCSRDQPTLVCQEVSVVVDRACDIVLRAEVDLTGIDGRACRHLRETPGEADTCCDGALLWESAGGVSTCGLAYVTELIGAEAEADRPSLDGVGLTTERSWKGRRGGRYRLRQLASIVPSVMHSQPDYEAMRLVALAADSGFDQLRKANRACWKEIWKGRIRLVGAPERWQAMADAAFFYLMTSTHPSSHASTSIFGLATWHDYHYYFGHVMWDIETFCAPPLIFLQPHAAEAILDYRSRGIDAARGNARLMGRRGAQFPWESAPSSSQESAPIPGKSAWHEDHVTLDVARAFALYADVSGDHTFLHDKAWPVLSAVADWIKSRVTKTARGYEIKLSMGIAERETCADNAVFTNMAAAVVLRDVQAAAERLGKPVDPEWAKIAEGLVLPRRGDIIVSHDDYRSNEEKGPTPDPLMGIFPLPYGFDSATEKETLSYFLNAAPDYIGSPMLSALYGVWAARTGDRALSARMLEEGYAKFCTERFMQVLEYREDVFPEQPRAGPFFANMGGFLTGLILGFPKLNPGSGDPGGWAGADVVLPAGWDAIEIDQLWIRGKPWRLVAKHGSPSRLTPV